MADIVIVGAGAAGLTAAIYAARAGLSTVIVDKAFPGGQLTMTDNVENYPGFLSISGQELVSKMHEQALHFGAELVTDDVRRLIPMPGGDFQLEGQQNTWEVKTVIVATGASPRTLNIPGEKQLTGRGVSYCATCDGPFFRDKAVAVIGGGDTALDEGIYLTRFASQVTIVHRREQLRAEQILQDRAYQNPKVGFEMPYLPERILGEQKVEGLQIRHRQSGETKVLDCEGVFVFVGYEPSSELVARIVDLDEGGYIKTNDNMGTKVTGLFACGDCRSKPLRQAITACGEGATAAFAASRYLESLSH